MPGDGVDLVAEAQSAQDLQAAKAQVAGLRVDEHLAPLLYQQRLDPVLSQQSRGGKSGRAGTDDEYGDARDVGHGRLPGRFHKLEYTTI